MSTELVLVSRDADVATVTLNRPEKLNALTKPMWRRLGEVINELSADNSLRCIVVRGAGNKSFAPGNDISEFENERSTSAQAKDYAATHLPALAALHDCRHPLVALIHGICVGGGLEIAALCDLRICGRSSRFGIPINRLGLVAGHEELKGLLALVGPAVTRELLLEGQVIGADDALRKGIVNRVVADDQVETEAYATARRIADGAPLAARWHKKFLRRLESPAPLSETETDEAYACYDTADFRTGYRAFLAKQKPKFAGN
jgi:enoyl-CoA hydratase